MSINKVNTHEPVRIDLSNSPRVFDPSMFELRTSVGVIYGSNGTGKSTLTRFIGEQCDTKFDVRVFDGYGKIVGQNDNLNALVLGEQNTDIDSQISQLKDTIDHLQKQIDVFDNDLEQPDDKNIENCWTRLDAAGRQKESKETAYEKLLRDEARKIKEYNPRISSAAYNKTNLENELAKACRISEEELQTYTKILSEQEKIAKELQLLISDNELHKLFTDVNNAITEELPQKVEIPWLEDKSAVRQKFAQDGLSIHNAGDECAFCGNVVTEELIQQLNSFFNSQQSEELKSKLIELEGRIKEYEEKLKKTTLEVQHFYTRNQKKASDLNLRLVQKKEDYNYFFNNLLSCVQGRLNAILSPSPEISEQVPHGLDDLIQEINDLIKQNNDNNSLKEEKENARNNLRYSMIYDFLNSSEYCNAKADCETAEIALKKCQNEYDSKNDNRNKIASEVKSTNAVIGQLKSETVSTQKAVNEINSVLDTAVDFTLVNIEDHSLNADTDNQNRGYYCIEDKRTHKRRNVKQLSTGEKNIIAFLYFIESLKDTRRNDNRPFLIVFDDPMSSNDEAMQYIIIEELRQLVKSKDEPTELFLSPEDRIIILTHNQVFYMYLMNEWKRKRFNGQAKNVSDKNFGFVTAIHLNSTDGETHITCVNKKDDDFKNTYDVLWDELYVAYKNENNSESLLNSMRRIVETYCSFEGIEESSFYDKSPRSVRMALNKGSHAPTDIASRATTLGASELLHEFQQCFKANNAEPHFKRFWPEEREINS